MVPHDVSDETPGMLLVARLHVDLCRLSSAMCPRPGMPVSRTA